MQQAGWIYSRTSKLVAPCVRACECSQRKQVHAMSSFHCLNLQSRQAHPFGARSSLRPAAADPQNSAGQTLSLAVGVLPERGDHAGIFNKVRFQERTAPNTPWPAQKKLKSESWAQLENQWP